MSSWKLIFVFTIAIKLFISVVPLSAINPREPGKTAALRSIRIDRTIDIGRHNGRFVFGAREENEQPLGNPFNLVEHASGLFIMKRDVVLESTKIIKNTVPGRRITRVELQSVLHSKSVKERAEIEKFGEQEIIIKLTGEPGHSIIFYEQLYGV